MTTLHKPIVQRIRAVLHDDPRVQAAWLEGALAREEEDDFSDIDLWVVVKDSAYDQFIQQRELFSAHIGTVLSVLYPSVSDPDEGLDSFQVIFENHPVTLALDVYVMKESAMEPLTVHSSAQEWKVLFDKAQLVQYEPANPDAVQTYARELYDDVSLRFWHLLPRVSVYLQREDTLEAFHWYLARVEDCITLYRIQHTPEKVDWGWKDIEYDLSEDVVGGIYEVIPELKAKAIRKKVSALAKLFLRQQRVLAKQYKVELPEALIEHVMNSID